MKVFEYGLGVLLILGFASVSLPAEDVDPQMLKALEDTQKVLGDPTARAKAAGQDPQALTVQKQVETLTGSPENAAEIYKIASQVLGNLVTQTGGDPQKMMDLLNKAAKNPEAFGNSLTKEQKDAIHALSLKLPANDGKLP